MRTHILGRVILVGIFASLWLASPSNATTTVTYEITGSGAIGGLGGWTYSIPADTPGIAVIQYNTGGVGEISPGSASLLTLNFGWVGPPQQVLPFFFATHTIGATGSSTALLTLPAVANNTAGGITLAPIFARVVGNVTTCNGTACGTLFGSLGTIDFTNQYALGMNRLVADPNAAPDVLSVAGSATTINFSYKNSFNLTFTETMRSPNLPPPPDPGPAIPEPNATLRYLVGLGVVGAYVVRRRSRLS